MPPLTIINKHALIYLEISIPICCGSKIHKIVVFNIHFLILVICYLHSLKMFSNYIFLLMNVYYTNAYSAWTNTGQKIPKMSELTGSNHQCRAQFKCVQTVVGQRFAGKDPTVCPTILLLLLLLYN